ncbi:hypothetical protein ABPG77_005553 [Micractinium sp. CCAP 211/92]
MHPGRLILQASNVLAPPPGDSAGGSPSSPDPDARSAGAPVTPNHLFIIVIAVILLLMIFGAVAQCIARRQGERFLDLLQRWRLGGNLSDDEDSNFLSRRVREQAQRLSQRHAAQAAAAAAVPPPLLVLNPGFEVFCAVKEGSCSPTKSSMADEPAACSPEGAAPGGQQDESDLTAAGFLPQLFVYDREAALATPDMLVYGQVQAQLELAAVSGQSAGREVEQQQQTSQTNFQRNGPNPPPARCDVAPESSAS